MLKAIRHIVYTIAYKVLTPNQKIDLAKFTIADRTNGIVDKEISTEPYYSFLRNSDDFSKAFCKNYINNWSKFTAQIGQDCFVDTYFKGKQNGFFIEIGVGNGVDLSNTYFLEKERLWNGLLIEPCKTFQSSIQAGRKAQLINKAISNQSGQTVQFVEDLDAGYLSGIESEKTNHIKNKVSYAVETINFQDLMKNLDENIVIDYLSIDIEGNELELIKSIDFNTVDVKVISVEHNKDAEVMKQLITYMSNFNYQYYDNDYFDWEIIFYK